MIKISSWSGPYLRKQWENNFVNHLSHKEKQSIYLIAGVPVVIYGTCSVMKNEIVLKVKKLNTNT